MLLQLSAQSLNLYLHATLATHTPTATQTPSAPFWSPTGGGWGDPAIVAAIIGAIAVLIAALIAGWIAIYQTLQTRKMEREKQENQLEEAAQHEMLMAQDNLARAAFYRKALHSDPYISYLQILDMPQPLGVANIYVRVRVHEDTITRYPIDPTLVTAAKQRDSDSFFQARRHYLETALDPDAAIRKYRLCVVVGDPGAGKTTLLKYPSQGRLGPS